MARYSNDPFLYSQIQGDECRAEAREAAYERFGVHQAMPESASSTLQATFRRLLLSDIEILRVLPAWCWEMEFMLRIWPTIEREYHSPTDEGSKELVAAIQKTKSVAEAVNVIVDWLEPKEGAAAPF